MSDLALHAVQLSKVIFAPSEDALARAQLYGKVLTSHESEYKRTYIYSDIHNFVPRSLISTEPEMGVWKIYGQPNKDTMFDLERSSGGVRFNGAPTR